MTFVLTRRGSNRLSENFGDWDPAAPSPSRMQTVGPGFERISTFPRPLFEQAQYYCQFY